MTLGNQKESKNKQKTGYSRKQKRATSGERRRILDLLNDKSSRDENFLDKDDLWLLTEEE